MPAFRGLVITVIEGRLHGEEIEGNRAVPLGNSAVRPDGAFYLFLKSPEPDASSFCEKAKKYELLLVPSDSFGCEGYVRISYCVETETIKRALPAFKKLMEEYR